MALTLIYTRTDKWLISKEEVAWTVWQHKLYWFMASLPFDTGGELAGFLKEDFHLQEGNKQDIINTLAGSTAKTFELDLNPGNKLTITPLQLDLLSSEGEIIDWKEWRYFFAKKENGYVLWVYLDGIAEQVREIMLGDAQIKLWLEKGNAYISELAANLQKKDSESYSEAIHEGRRLL